MARAGAETAADVRRARAEDIPAIGESLARAFEDDPVMEWLVSSDRRRLGVLRRFMALRTRQLLRQDEVWTTRGGEGAALWALPGQWHDPPRNVWQMLRALSPDILAHVPSTVRGLDRIEKAHTGLGPHMYLAVLGTHPEHQGQGFGSRLLAPVLEDCDANLIDAYLESSKESNLAIYARHGFKVTGEIALPRGPTIWSMWREPR